MAKDIDYDIRQISPTEFRLYLNPDQYVTINPWAMAAYSIQGACGADEDVSDVLVKDLEAFYDKNIAK